MDKLSAFLKENIETIPNKKIVVSNRIKDENGKPVEWEIRAITTEENDELQRKSYVTTKQPNGQITREFDGVIYKGLLLAESVVFPDLRNAKLQDSFGVKTPAALLKKMLFPFEEKYLAEEVTNYSNIENLNDLVNEAKN